MDWKKALLGGALALSLTAPAAARDIIGGSDEEEEKEAPPPQPKKKAPGAGKQAPPAKAEPAKPAPDAKPAPGAKPAPDAKSDGKAAPAAKAPHKHEKTEAEIEAEEEAAAEAARKKADAEKQKKKDEEAAKKKAIQDARRSRTANIEKDNLDAARTERRYTRTKNGVTLSVRLRPGALVDNKLVAIELEANEKLDEPDPTYGDYAPVENAAMLMTLTYTTAPATADPKAKPTTAASALYAVHPLVDPGKYGLHFTLPAAGTWEVKLHGKTRSGKEVDAVIPLHVGVWPPPDLEQEATNNNSAGGGSGRAIVE